MASQSHAKLGTEVSLTTLPPLAWSGSVVDNRDHKMNIVGAAARRFHPQVPGLVAE